ncbi:Spo0B domain-containing protein [Paenibacillus sp. MBLB4367]|uniref:Spo0B domain-containing protein n=1 Tax=Paenibacillus sp. MBLB4367 TaxID=3384767 RepID=UPI0039082CD2
MRQWNNVRALLWLANAAALAAMIGFAMPFYGRLLLGLWLAAGTMYVHREERRRRRLESDQHLIRTLSHHRHDWMNELQVLYGYIRLKKYEKLQDYVDKIKATVMQESFISKLGDPELVAYLLSFRVDKRNMALEVDIEQEIDLPAMPLQTALTARLIRETIDIFDSFAMSGEGEPNVLSLSVDVEENQLLLDYVYQGSYDENGLRTAIAGKLKAYATCAPQEESEYSEERAVVTIRLPFRG